MKSFYYFYKITNIKDGCYYYGVHGTDDLDDGYMGSGTKLNLMYKKIGIKNFKKEILVFFNTLEEAYEYEAKIVNEEVIKDKKCYNIKPGGFGFNSKGKTIVQDANGKHFLCDINNPKYVNGEYISIHKGIGLYKDSNGKAYRLNVDDEKVLSKEVVPYNTGVIGSLKGKKIVSDKNGQHFAIDINDPRIGEEFISVNKGKTLYVDKNGKTYFTGRQEALNLGLVPRQKGKIFCKNIYTNESKMLSVDDEEYLSGTFIPYNKGWKRNEEQEKRFRESLSHRKKTFGQSATKGKCKMFKYNEYGIIEIKFINKDEKEEYIKQGWKNGNPKPLVFNKEQRQNNIRGRKFIYNTKTGEQKLIKEEDINTYISNGWQLGVLKEKRCKSTNKGKMWIHNLNERKCINKEDFENFRLQGWNKGMGKIKIW